MCACVLIALHVFFLMIRRPPRSTLDRSSAASDVYKRQGCGGHVLRRGGRDGARRAAAPDAHVPGPDADDGAVSYTHLRAHETVLDLVCRLLLEKKKEYNTTCNRTRLITYKTTQHVNTTRIQRPQREIQTTSAT